MSKAISIEDVPINRFHQILTAKSCGGAFVDGYVLSIIGVALPQISFALGLSTLWQSLIAMSALFGVFFGGFLGGVLTSRLGRKIVFFIGPIIFLICSIAQVWSDSGMSLAIWRFIIGIGVGIEYPVATAFLVEFLPKTHRAQRLAMLTISWFAGASAAYVAGEVILHLSSNEGWRMVIASTAVLSVALIALRAGTPESPRWLVSLGRREEARGIIKQVYGPDFDLRNLPEQQDGRKLSFGDLLHSGYGKRMFFVSMFWICSVIPVFAVYAFAPKVLEALNLSGKWTSYGSVAITMLFVVGCVIAARLVNVLGRRKLLLHSMFWSGLCLMLLGFFSHAQPALILMMFGAYALLIGGAQIMQFVYPNEIFPTEIRPGAVGIGTSMSRIGAMIGIYLVPIGIQSVGIGETMYWAAGVTFVGWLTSWFLAPETMGANLSDAASLPTGKSRLEGINKVVADRS
ncbi:MFS transporter [Enterobacter hormaechei]|uniref:MFS transporter n=1 Tax=Enterobacter hormaechei TaxID=158836 RepID=UPI003CF7F802